VNCILLADDSPHAQRMGERILREEGFEVVSVTDGATALIRMTDVDPDLVIADAFLRGRNGFDVCRHVKAHHRHARVILTAGLLEALDEDEARRAGCDAILRTPFEASVAIGTIRPLMHDAQLERGAFADAVLAIPVSDAPPAPPPPDRERIQAAVAAALEEALPDLTREITEKVLLALGHRS